MSLCIDSFLSWLYGFVLQFCLSIFLFGGKAETAVQQPLVPSNSPTVSSVAGAMSTTRRGAAAANVAAAEPAVEKKELVAEECGPAPAPYTHALVVITALLPLVVHIPVNVNIVLLPALTIYAGSWRSVKTSGPPGETMTQKDAMQFPLIGRHVQMPRSYAN